VNPPSGPALLTSKESTYLQWHSSRGSILVLGFFFHANIHFQHFTSLINFLNFIFQNLSCQHLCNRFVQTSFAVSVWSWKYLWSNMFINHSLFWIIILENGTRRGECEWRSVLKKISDFSHDVSRELEMPSPKHYKTYQRLFHSNVVIYWKWTYLLLKNETVTTDCYTTPQTRPYTINKLVQLMLHKLLDCV